MGPALLMSETRACLRTLAQAHCDVGEILTHANRVLAADTADFHFVTLAMVRLDPETGDIVYASAGQRGYVLHPAGNVTVLDSTSIPLGVEPETVVSTAPPLVLRPGDIMTFFTDGLFEAESPGRVRFGVGRALDVIRSERDKPARQIVDAIHDEVTGFCRHSASQDDITIVIVKTLVKE
jgi:sigma-B regulation protein RsbU (phosphoserine phosphatase)